MRFVADLAAGERIAPKDARKLVQSLAQALVAWEAAHEPNEEPHARVSPRSVKIAPGGVGALHAAPREKAVEREEASLLWTPPLQARGAAWDAAANRYALGLVLYRLITGAHPAHGERRVRLDSSWSPPPFPEDVSRALPLGVQATILAMLDPATAVRPASAAGIVSAVQMDNVANGLLHKMSAGRIKGSTRMRPPRGAPSVVGIAVVLLGLLAVTAIASGLGGVGSGTTDVPAETRRPPIHETRPVPDATRRAARRVMRAR